MAKPAATPAIAPKSFVLPPDTQKLIAITVKGSEVGMLQNRYTEAAQDEVRLGKKAGNKETAAQRDARKQAAWEQTAHVTKDGRRGHPAEGFLRAIKNIVDSVEVGGGKIKFGAQVLRAVQVVADEISAAGIPLVLFTGCETSDPDVEPATHWAMIQGKTPVPVYRTHLKNWQAEVRVSYDSSVLSPEDVITLLQKAGAKVGVGAYRLEKGGVFGGFRVVGAYEVNA